MDELEEIPIKISKKILIITGILTPISTIVGIYFSFIRHLPESINFRRTHFNEGITNAEILVLILFFIVLVFSVLVAVGAYFHAMDSEMGKDLVLVSGIGTIVSLGFWGGILLLVGSAASLEVLAPVILAFITIIQTIATKHKIVSLDLNRNA